MGGLAAIASGVLFIVYSLLGFAVGRGDEPSPLDILAIVAYVLQVVGLVGFHTLQGRNYGRIRRAGLYITIGAIVLWEVLILISLFLGDVGIEWLVPVGVLGSLVGLVLYVQLLCKRGCCRAGAGYCSSYLCLLAYS